MHTVQKQPREKFHVGVDFENDLAEGEALVVGNSDIFVYDKAGEDVTTTIYVAGSLAVSGTVLQAQVQAGTVAEQEYKVSFLAATDNSPANKFEEDLMLVMID